MNQVHQYSLSNSGTLPPTSQPNCIERLLRISDVRHLTGLGRSTIYAKIKNEEFPQPVRVHGTCVAWKESEVGAWIAALPRAVA